MVSLTLCRFLDHPVVTYVSVGNGNGDELHSAMGMQLQRSGRGYSVNIHPEAADSKYRLLEFVDCAPNYVQVRSQSGMDKRVRNVNLYHFRQWSNLLRLQSDQIA